MRHAVLVALSAASSLVAQQPPRDTAQSLSAVVVTAERTRTSLSSSIASVTRLSAADLARTPRATIADVLRRAPGFAVIDFDGLGFDPQLMVRGFYGGGEAEYVVVLVDGRPVNQVQTGLVAWDVLPPLASIEAIEIVRGSGSPLYGDAAIGGVINVITRTRLTTPRAQWDASAGSFGAIRASVDELIATSRGDLALGVAIDHTDGFREHSGRTSTRTRLLYPLSRGPLGRLGLTARFHRRSFDEPGPLLASLMSTDRSAADPMFRFDHTTDESHALTVDGDRRLGAHIRFTGSLDADLQISDAMRTLALAPGFGDTKQRKATTFHGAANGQLEIGDTPLPGTESIVVGAELTNGTLSSKYWQVASGTRGSYLAASGEPGAPDAHGNSRRTIGSLHAQYSVTPEEWLRIAIGGRFDALRDVFRPTRPNGASNADATHTAFSPRAGVNLRYLNADRGSGNAYVTVSRSFKAPTLDQLYDLRSIPIPVPPFSIRTSNPDLEPQHGTNVEAGLYHSARLSSSLRADASISAYHMAMRDELDFDVASFRYVNIGRSQHRGLEAGANIAGDNGSIFASYTLQAATSQSGANAGKRLKAIPRHSVSAGGSMQPTRMLDISLLATNTSGVYLDDPNTAQLRGFTRLDARAALDVRGVNVFVDIRNLLGARYSSSGFLDPAGSGEAYFYPAAGRVIEIGIRR